MVGCAPYPINTGMSSRTPQPPLDDLDAAFELSDTVTDEKLRGLYEVLVSKMRNEAKSLPMTTVQTLLIERIATNYVMLKAREKGANGGFTSASAQQQYNNFWLSMTQEFNRMLGKSPEPLNGNDRKAFLREIQQIIVKTITSTASDPRVRSQLLENMATAFENAGL